MTDLELDEILTVRWPAIVRRVMAEGAEDWIKGFARSIARHGKRQGWRPSAKQERVMRQLLEQFSGPTQEVDLFERG